MTETFLQYYCWGIISLLAGLLTAQMLVVGSNLHLVNAKLDTPRKRLILQATGRKWVWAFATLLTLGAMAFVCFPPFFQNAFFHGPGRIGLLLVSALAFQVIASAICHWTAAPLENGLFRFFLAILGFLATFGLGTAIGLSFTGTDFVVEGALDTLKALAHPHALLLGLTGVLLTFLLGALYLLYSTDDSGIRREMYISIQRWFFPFVAVLVTWLVMLMFRKGYAVEADGTIALERGKYFANLLAVPAIPAMLLAGIVLVILGLVRGGYVQELDGFWFAAPGTILLVMAVFLIAGFNNTPYYPSFTDLQSSLTVPRSAAGFETLKTVSWVSLSLPLLVAGLGWAWHHVGRPIH